MARTKKSAKTTTAAKTTTRTYTRYAGNRIVVLKSSDARPGTLRAKAMAAIAKAKTTDAVLPQLKKMGADPSFLHFAVHTGLIKLVRGKQQPNGGNKAA